MALTLEWYEGMRHVNYPFRDSISPAYKQLFTDAYILHDQAPKPVKLECFDISGGIVLAFGDGTPLLQYGSCATQPDSNVVFSSYLFGSYRIMEWQRLSPTTEFFTEKDVVARFVLLDEEVANHSYPLTLTNAQLIDSLVHSRPKGVRKLAVTLPGLPCCIGGGVIEGSVALQAGSNLQLSSTQSNTTARPTSTIVFDAIPGAGEGRFLECVTEDRSLISLSGRNPDRFGNLNLNAADCVWLERPQASVHAPVYPNTHYTPIFDPIGTFEATQHEVKLKVHANCAACCDCQDYAEVYKNWYNVYQKGKAVSESIYQSLNTYRQLVDRYKTLKSDCPEVSWRLGLTARPDYHLAVASSLANSSTVDYGVTVLKWTIVPLGFIVEPGSGLLTLPKQGSVSVDPLVVGNTVSVTIPEVIRSGITNYSFEIRWPLGTNRLNAIANVTAAAELSTGTLTTNASAALLKPIEKD